MVLTLITAIIIGALGYIIYLSYIISSITRSWAEDEEIENDEGMVMAYIDREMNMEIGNPNETNEEISIRIPTQN